MRLMIGGFLDALAAADLAWVEPVYPTRENPQE